MRISDWSSDVCSSDLRHHGTRAGHGAGPAPQYDGSVTPAAALYTVCRNPHQNVMPSQHAPKLRSLATVLCGVAAISMCITTANASVSAPDTGKPYDVHADARRVERLARRVVAEARIPVLAMAVVQAGTSSGESRVGKR